MKTTALNALLDELYRLDPGAFSALRAFSGHTIQLQLADLKRSFFLQVTDTGFRTLDQAPPITDLFIDATLVSLVRFGLFKDPIRQLPLHFQGNPDLALSLQRVAQCYQGKPSHWLAQHLGETPVLFGKQLLSGISRLFTAPLATTRDQLGDYLVYETQTLAPKPAIDAFNQAVNDLNLALARAEAQTTLLASQLDALLEQ